jgi:hypothetical protein
MDIKDIVRIAGFEIVFKMKGGNSILNKRGDKNFAGITG